MRDSISRKLAACGYLMTLRRRRTGPFNLLDRRLLLADCATLFPSISVDVAKKSLDKIVETADMSVLATSGLRTVRGFRGSKQGKNSCGRGK
jgi:hypothetical protein